MNEQTARYLVGQATNEKEGTWGSQSSGESSDSEERGPNMKVKTNVKAGQHSIAMVD